MKSANRLPRAVIENLVIRELDEETLVYDMERDHAHCLNQTAALVWQHCDGKTTAQQAARFLKSSLGNDVDSDLVWLAVKQLEKFHLVERGAETPRVSRRTLVLKYAPVALALPVIMSITAPTVAGASSCAFACNPCGSLPCCPGLSCDGICFPCGARTAP
jgi:hypothetical protein